MQRSGLQRPTWSRGKGELAESGLASASTSAAEAALTGALIFLTAVLKGQLGGGFNLGPIFRSFWVQMNDGNRSSIEFKR